ncbi:MAG: hypothetical protein ACLFP2_03380 [Candidatus Woesearchaeota archaeon]
MRFTIYPPRQEYLFTRIADWIKKEIEPNPHAIIYRGSRTCTPEQETDLDAMVVADGFTKQDKFFEVAGYDIDITLISPEELHKRVTDIHLDSIERVSMMDMSYLVWQGDISSIERDMNQAIIDDFNRFKTACIGENQAEYTAENLLLYPLMLDLYRLPTINEPARLFFESNYLAENNKLLPAKIFIAGRDTEPGEPIPQIKQQQLRDTPLEYSIATTHLEQLPPVHHKFNLMDHFKEYDGKFIYDPRIEELLE